MCMYFTVCSLYMYELLYCNVCTLCTACSGVVCGKSIVICCIVSPPWPPQGPRDTYHGVECIGTLYMGMTQKRWWLYT